MILDPDSEPTTSSSFMSMADRDHILTVLGSRAGFSAATQWWQIMLEDSESGTSVVDTVRKLGSGGRSSLCWTQHWADRLTWLGRLLAEGQLDLAG